MHFFYDAQKHPTMLEFNGIIYSYARSAQGDIIGIIDSLGDLVVKYMYNAWGQIASVYMASTDYALLSKMNPFRYRGYIYDDEIALYYLKSRYYNAVYTRFIHSDILVGKTDAILTNNTFLYCLNNAPRTIDDSGEWPSLGDIFAAAAIAVTAVVVAAAVVATAGAAGAAIGVAAGMYLGTSAATSVAIGTAATVGAYCVAGGIMVCGASDASEQITGVNVLEDAMGEETYNTIKIGLYSVANASIVTSAYGYESERNRIEIDKIGKLVPSNHPDKGFYGVRYRVYRPGSTNYSLRSIEFHTHLHKKANNPHWQLNYWNQTTNSVSGKKYWTWYGRRIR